MVIPRKIHFIKTIFNLSKPWPTVDGRAAQLIKSLIAITITITDAKIP